MRLYLLFSKITVSVVFIIACTQKKNDSPLSETKVDQLKKNFLTRLLLIDSTYRLDSFAFVRLDTLTEKQKAWERLADVINEIDDKTAQLELESDLAKNQISQAKLHGMLSDELGKYSSSKAKETLSKAETLLKETRLLVAKKDSLIDIYRSADSVTAIGYYAVNLYQLRLKDESVERDTCWIILNLNKDIISREEFVR